MGWLLVGSRLFAAYPWIATAPASRGRPRRRGHRTILLLVREKGVSISSPQEPAGLWHTVTVKQKDLGTNGE